MKGIEGLLPPGYSFRELWLPELIIPNSSLLGSIHGGHALALTGALLGSTVNGLEMRGAELVTITDHADLSIADLLTVVLPTFILKTTFDSGAGADMGLMNLNNGAVIARLNSTTGALDFIFKDADGAADETVSTTKVSWAANTPWQVGFTFAKAVDGTISVRLYINGIAENTNDHCDTDITIPAGDTTLGYDGTTYLTGKLQRNFLVWDTVILTADQMLEVYKGIPYATNLKAYLPFDHPGRGLTMPDRSTGGNCSGTISGTNTAAIWDFDARKQAALSLDGINDHGASSSGVDISGDLTLIWAGKMKSTYDTLSAAHRLAFLVNTDTYRIEFEYDSGLNAIVWLAFGTGGSPYSSYTTRPSIDDYLILIGTLTLAGAIGFFVNGSLVGTGTGAGVITNAAAIAYLGADSTLGSYDVNKPLLVGLVDGALSVEEAKRVSRTINKMLGLGLTI